MNVELGTDLIAQRLVRLHDPLAQGAFVEVGLGNINFSFTWAAPMGFRCHAVEALPSERLRQACSQHQVNLVEAAMAEQRGELPIYVGELNGSALSDVSSLNPRWWGSGSKARIVPSLSPADFFEDHRISRTTMFKVDTEGSEFTILNGLCKLSPAQLPLIIVFEYGGGATRASRQAGWTDEFFGNTLRCLETLQAAGYSSGLLVEQALPGPRLFDLQQTRDLQALFPSEAFVGNAIITRPPLAAETVAEIQRNIAPELAADARLEAARRRREKFRHYRIRFVEGFRRRFRRG